MMRFMCEPSTTTEFSTGVSRPPSVAVPPVRATTLTPCSSAKASSRATSSVLSTITTAAGIGIVYTPKIFCSLRKLSMLLSRSTCSSVTNAVGADDLLQVFDDGVTSRGHGSSSSSGVQWKIGYERSNSASVLLRMS